MGHPGVQRDIGKPPQTATDRQQSSLFLRLGGDNSNRFKTAKEAVDDFEDSSSELDSNQLERRDDRDTELSNEIKGKWYELYHFEWRDKLMKKGFQRGRQDFGFMDLSKPLELGRFDLFLSTFLDFLLSAFKSMNSLTDQPNPLATHRKSLFEKSPQIDRFLQSIKSSPVNFLNIRKTGKPTSKTGHSLGLLEAHRSTGKVTVDSQAHQPAFQTAKNKFVKNEIFASPSNYMTATPYIDLHRNRNTPAINKQLNAISSVGIPVTSHCEVSSFGPGAQKIKESIDWTNLNQNAQHFGNTVVDDREYSAITIQRLQSPKRTEKGVQMERKRGIKAEFNSSLSDFLNKVKSRKTATMETDQSEGQGMTAALQSFE